MSNRQNIMKFSYCYGCGVCAASCSKKIIKIRINKDGFYEPHIDNPEKCTMCGICLDVHFCNRWQLLTDEYLCLRFQSSRSIFTVR